VEGEEVEGDEVEGKGGEREVGKDDAEGTGDTLMYTCCSCMAAADFISVIVLLTAKSSRATDTRARSIRQQRLLQGATGKGRVPGGARLEQGGDTHSAAHLPHSVVQSVTIADTGSVVLQEHVWHLWRSP
jgi:hypothetical protein